MNRIKISDSEAAAAHFLCDCHSGMFVFLYFQ